MILVYSKHRLFIGLGNRRDVVTVYFWARCVYSASSRLESHELDTQPLSLKYWYIWGAHVKFSGSRLICQNISSPTYNDNISLMTYKQIISQMLKDFSAQYIELT